MLSLGALALASAPVMAAWPEKPIELVVGFSPGGGTDITARTLAVFLGKELGTTALVLNKPGASGEIGLGFVAKAPATGYVLGMTNMPGLVTLPIERRTRFDERFHLHRRLGARPQRLQRAAHQQVPNAGGSC